MARKIFHSVEKSHHSDEIERKFMVKYLGSLPTMHLGTEDISRVTSTIYAQNKHSLKRLKSFDLDVVLEGLRLIERLSQQPFQCFFIRQIIYCGVDRIEPRIFVFVYRSDEGCQLGLDCHAFFCASKGDAKAVALKMSQNFEKLSLRNLRHKRTSHDREFQSNCSATREKTEPKIHTRSELGVVRDDSSQELKNVSTIRRTKFSFDTIANKERRETKRRSGSWILNLIRGSPTPTGSPPMSCEKSKMLRNHALVKHGKNDLSEWEALVQRRNELLKEDVNEEQEQVETDCLIP